MSVESWARRASGLLVPTMGFANHPLGRWQPCVGPCCGVPEACTDCFPGAEPESIWIDVPAIANGTCESCADWEGTYELLRFYTCQWGIAVTKHCPCSPLYYPIADLMVWTEVVAEKCRWSAFLRTCVGTTQNVQWRLERNDAVSSFDVTIPFYVNTGTQCDGTGTEVRVYT